MLIRRQNDFQTIATEKEEGTKHDSDIRRFCAIEELAIILHRSGRAAVEAGQTFDPQRSVFLDWAHLPDQVKEGRRSQAKALIEASEVVIII